MVTIVKWIQQLCHVYQCTTKMAFISITSLNYVLCLSLVPTWHMPPHEKHLSCERVGSGDKTSHACNMQVVKSWRKPWEGELIRLACMLQTYFMNYTTLPYSYATPPPTLPPSNFRMNY